MRTPEETRILKAYAVHRSIRKVASLVGMSYGYVRNVLARHGALLPWSGFERVKRSTKGRRGPVSKYMEKHPNVVMPSSNSEIARLVGCSLDDVHSWRVARWAKFKLIARRVVPRKIIRSWRFGRTEIELVDGRSLGFDELVAMEAQLRKEAKR